MFRNMKTGTRLALGFGLVLALLIGSSLFAINRVEFTAGLTGKLYKHPFTVSTSVLRIDGNLVRMGRSMKDVALAKSPQEIDKAVAEVDASEKKVFEDIPVLREAFLGDPRMIERLNKAVSDWKPVRDSVIALARAGEHGKGFAVVAAEVRKLAERSQVAAQEIGELATSSVEKAESAGKLLDDMVPAIGKTSELVQEIAAASAEQSSGVGQVNTAMNQLNQITQQNASASEELAATAEEMGAQAAQLQQVMGFFKVGAAS